MSADNILIALQGVREVLVDESRPEEDFYAAAHTFLQTFHAQLDDRGLEPAPLEDWDPRPALLAFEAALLADKTLSVDYAAAAKTVRDSLDSAAQEMARLN